MLNNHRGSTVVDYLMITAVIAGIAIPIASKYFAGPLLDTFQSQRGRLVQFVAQTPRQRKQSVPTPWFSAEQQANVKGQGSLSAPADLPPSGEITLGNVSETGNIGQAELSEGSGGSTGKVGEGQAGGPASIGQASIGAGGGKGGGGGSGLDSSNSLSGDFFAKEKEGGAAVEGADGGAGRNTYGKGGSSFESEAVGTGRSGAGTSEKKADGGSEEKGKEEGGLSVEKKRDVLAGQAQEVERERAGKFDWWQLVKLIILALIIFLGVLIILSNLKRR